jgi:hypothetical protein
MRQQLAQPPGLHPHQRVRRSVERGVLAEDVDGDGIALQPFGITALFTIDEIGEQRTRTLGALERLARQHTLKHFSHCGGSRRIVSQVANPSAL